MQRGNFRDEEVLRLIEFAFQMIQALPCFP